LIVAFKERHHATRAATGRTCSHGDQASDRSDDEGRSFARRGPIKRSQVSG